MADTAYRTAPEKSDKMPSSIFFIVGNEAAERFSYYGMNSILVYFMTHYLVDASGKLAPMSEARANVWYHTFVTMLYYLPTIGAILADAFLGKYRMIFYLSIVYCFGHFALAINDTETGLVIGLSLIAMGAGGIKPCVSANVGDQFGPSNQHLLTKAFSWFYFAINAGSFVSTLLIPWILHNPKLGPKVAFGTPGVFMLLATVIFWLGRRRYVHIPPGGTKAFEEAFSPEGRKALGSLLILVPFVSMFWAIWQQNFSSWVEQAAKMDRHISLNVFGHDFSFELLAEQVQTVNPILILPFLWLFPYVIYPAIDKVFPLTPLRKISIGLFLTAGAFVIPAWVETQFAKGLHPHIVWQMWAYVILTAAEIMVSVTHLEFCYTQAPKKLKSLVMAMYLAAVASGNLFTALVNKFIQNPDGSVKLSGASYFMFFIYVMLGTAVLFIFVAMWYKGKTYVQDEAPEAAQPT